MSAPVEIKSETAYDALIDGWSLVRRILAGPCTLQELAAAEGATDLARLEKTLARLERQGFVQRDGQRWVRTASAIEGDRREGIVTSISRAVLPLLTELVRDPGAGYLVQLDLGVSPVEQAAFSKLARNLCEEIASISDEPAEVQQAYTAVVIGTSDVPPALPEGDRILETVRRCARQRSTPSEADRAVLRSVHGFIGDGSVAKAEAAMQAFAASLEGGKASTGRPTYTLVLAFGARGGAQGAAR